MTLTDPSVELTTPVADPIDRVARGDGSLRDLARDADFAAMMNPLAQQGRQEWEQMSASERDRRTAALDDRL